MVIYLRGAAPSGSLTILCVKHILLHIDLYVICMGFKISQCVFVVIFLYQNDIQPESKPRKVEIVGQVIGGHSVKFYNAGTYVLSGHDHLVAVRPIHYSGLNFGLQYLVQTRFCSRHLPISPH